jgi:autotransporter-associated beta strand protein
MCRGYYTRTVLAAWDWRDDTLTSRWIFDNKNGYPEYEGQGNHNLSVADVDEDGKDEIIYGACAIDDDGTGLWSTGLGHGDAMHVSDIDPSRPGLEKWGITESPSTSGSQLLDARTGEVIWETAPADVGRGVSADLTSSWPGMECWGNTGGLRSATGEPAGTYPSSSNFVIWWDSDDLRELLDNVSITKYGAGTLLTATNCASNNGTKATPCLSADLLGDWREEVIFRTVDNNALRLYITTYPCTRRLYTLMRDPQYRLSIAWQNVAYNQPPHTGFFLGYGMADPPPPPTIKAKLRWFAGNTWDNQVSKNWIHNDSLSVFQNGDDVLFDLSGSYSEPISVAGNITPSAVSIYAPYDLVFTGPGSLSGPMNLLKAGAGKLTLNADNDFSGTTYVWKGELLLNGSLANSPVEVYNGASAGGKGIFGNGLTLKNGAALYIGAASYADTLTIKRQMLTEGTSSLFFDLSSDTSSLLESNDLLMVDGDLAIGNKLSFNITLLDDSLQKGYYTLIRYTGTLNGTAECFTTAGLAGIPHKIVINDNSILLRILKLRNPSRIFWSGSQTPDWDVATSLNWLRNEEADWFVPNDTVIFDDSGDPGTGINLVGLLHIGMMTVDASLDYAIEGSGQITGPGGLIKNGTGTLKLLSQNDYHGPTTINKGIIEVSGLKNAGQPSPVGSSSADPSNFVFNGGTLRLLGSSSVTDHGMTLLDEGGTLNLLNSNTDLTVSGMITGTGMLRKTGKGTLILTRANTYSGGTLIRDGSIDLGSEEANQGAFGSGNVRLENTTLHMLVDRNTYTENCSWNLEVPSGYKADLSLDSRCTLTGSLTGAGTLNLIIPYVRSELDGDWSAFTGRINAITSSDEGWFLVGNNNSFGSASINLGDHVLMLYRESADAAVEIGELTGTEDSELGAGGEGTNSITWMIGGKNSTAEFHGLISDRQFKNTGSVTNIIKTGTGNWTLTHANTYSGTTEITGGILTVDCDGGSATGSGDVTVRAGAALRGRGSLAGKLIVESQASLTIGVGEQVEELIINLDASFEEGSYLSMHMDPLAKTCDKLTVEGKLKIGGILFINILTTGTFLPAETYRIFEAQEITGSFEMIIPKSPGEGLVWDTTWLKPYGLLRIAQEGTISVEHTHEKASLIVSPNPGKDMVEVSVCYPSQGMETVSVLKCYDHSGRLIRQVEMVRNGGYARCELETGNWSSGIYLFVVSTDKESLIERFIKQ